MFFSTNISPYLYLLSKVDEPGFLFGFKPPKISLTNILATRLGVPFKLSSVKSKPKVLRMFSTSFFINSIFSSSEIANASSLKGVCALVAMWSFPISS